MAGLLHREPGLLGTGLAIVEVVDGIEGVDELDIVVDVDEDLLLDELAAADDELFVEVDIEEVDVVLVV